ncbi:MAG: tol-pal system-associated acyl-CoA thioesterase [Brachymonas sp.]
MSFTFPIRVYWEDTDAGGIVFYANYLKFMERARTEWLRSLGISQQVLKEQTDCMFVVTDTQLKYLHPARLDDLLQVSTEIIEQGRASLTLKQEILGEITVSPSKNMPDLLSNKEQMNLLPKPASHAHGMTQAICQGTICIAWVDAATLKPGRIPSSVLEALA